MNVTSIDDRYEVLEELGRGGFGVVLKARQKATGQLVAIKRMLTTEIASDEEHQRRFKREMELISRLGSAHVVRLMDAGFDSKGHPYMVLEFVEGVPLSQLLKDKKPLPVSLIKRIIGQVLEAVAEAHSHGIVHRDLKPDNIMLSGSGRWQSAKVLDFGIAGIQQDFRDDRDETITQFGQIRGTPGYMAPEQFEVFDDPCVETDLYALGIILIECATGIRPGEGLGAKDIFQTRRSADLDLPRAVLDSELAVVIRQATRCDPKSRFASATDMLEALVDADGSDIVNVATARLDPASLGATPAGITPDEIGLDSPRGPDAPPIHFQPTISAHSQEIVAADSAHMSPMKFVVIAALILGGAVLVYVFAGSSPDSREVEATVQPNPPLEEPTDSAAETHANEVPAPKLPVEVKTAPVTQENRTEAPTESAPPDVTAELLQGFKALQRKKHGDAMTAFSKVLVLDPNHTDGLKGLTRAQIELGLYDEALATLERQKAASEFAEFVSFTLAVVSDRQGQAEEALDSYRLYIDEYPKGEFFAEATEAIKTLEKQKKKGHHGTTKGKDVTGTNPVAKTNGDGGNGTVVAPKLDID